MEELRQRSQSLRRLSVSVKEKYNISNLLFY